MKYSLKMLSIAGLLLSGSALASTTIIDFNVVDDGGDSFTNFNVPMVDGVTVNVSGWSDTANLVTDVNQDSAIKRAKDLDKWNGGWSMENRDEPHYNACGSNGHSADNFGTCGYRDYDFFLLSFSEAVSLVGATYSWVAGNNADQNQVSVAALDSSMFANSGSLDGKTWANVASNHTIQSDFAQITNDPDWGYLSMFNGSTQFSYSTHWLIGALNTNFGGETDWEGNDGMKLAKVGFNKSNRVGTLAPAQVPEPSTMVMFLIALIGLARFGRRRT